MNNYVCKNTGDFVVCEENYEITTVEPPGKVRLSKNGNYSCSLIDRQGGNRLMVVKDFAGPKINLYLVSWKDGDSELCFDYKEIQNYYPDITVDKDKVCITNTNTDEKMNLVLDQNGWVTRMIKDMCKSTI